MLQRAFGNVVDNALKYTGNGGKISISTEETPGWNIVRISDNGIGIPEKELHRIFERFYRVDKSRSVEGNGLGLSLAKAYVEIHHGRIKVESIEGEGTTFLISLPAN